MINKDKNYILFEPPYRDGQGGYSGVIVDVMSEDEWKNSNSEYSSYAEYLFKTVEEAKKLRQRVRMPDDRIIDPNAPFDPTKVEYQDPFYPGTMDNYNVGIGIARAQRDGVPYYYGYGAPDDPHRDEPNTVVYVGGQPVSIHAIRGNKPEEITDFSDRHDIDFKPMDEMLGCLHLVLDKQDEIYEASVKSKSIDMKNNSSLPKKSKFDASLASALGDSLSAIADKKKCIAATCGFAGHGASGLTTLSNGIKDTIVTLYKMECDANNIDVTEEELRGLIDNIFTNESREQVRQQAGEDFAGVFWDSAVSTAVQASKQLGKSLLDQTFTGRICQVLLASCTTFFTTSAKDGTAVEKEVTKTALKTVLAFGGDWIKKNGTLFISNGVDDSVDKMIQDLMKTTGANSAEAAIKKTVDMATNIVKEAFTTAAALGLTAGIDTLISIAVNGFTSYLINGEVKPTDWKPGSTFLKTTVKDICATAGALFFGKAGKAIGTIVGSVLGNLALKPFTDEFGATQEDWCAIAGAATLGGGMAGAAIGVVACASVPGVGWALLLGAAIGYFGTVAVHAVEERQQREANDIAFNMYLKEGVDPETAMAVARRYQQLVQERAGYWINNDGEEGAAQCMREARMEYGLNP